MTDFGKVAFVILIATLINGVARHRKNKEVASVIISGALLALILGLTGEMWRYDIVYVMALLFLVSSAVLNGQPLLTAFNQFLGGIKR